MRKKLIKRILIITASIFSLLVVAAIAIPFLFKDKIKAEIDKQIALYVDAKVNFKTEDFSLTLFKNFPDVTASLNNLSVINNAPFKNDTLASLSSLQITVDLMSVFGDNMKNKSWTLFI